MYRRTAIAIALACLIATSGCLSLATGGTAEFTASPANVSESALSDTGYEQSRADSQTLNRSVTVAGQERTIRVTNEIRVYQRSVDFGPLGDADLATFAVVSTPAAKVAGQSLNPVARASDRDVVRRFATRFADLRDVSYVNNRSVSALGEDRTVSKFDATTTILGDEEIDLSVHVTKFTHEDDVVLAIAAHPKRISGEQTRVNELIRALQH